MQLLRSLPWRPIQLAWRGAWGFACSQEPTSGAGSAKLTFGRKRGWSGACAIERAVAGSGAWRALELRYRDAKIGAVFLELKGVLCGELDAVA